MLKKDLRLFFASFFLSLLLTGWFAAFLYLDTASTRYKNASGIHAIELEQTAPQTYLIRLLGREYPFSLEKAEAFNQWRKKYACLVTPRPLRTAEQLYGLSRQGLYKLNLWYSSYQYQQNVMKSQAGVPVD